jgi:hypothetical protein
VIYSHWHIRLLLLWLFTVAGYPIATSFDVADSDRGIVVIELGGVVASGRYERNSLQKLLEDLRGRSNKHR